MDEVPFIDVVNKLYAEDPRYAVDAYFFLREALDFTTKSMKKPAEGEEKHVTGQELLDGIRRYAIQEFGPMTYSLLDSWGINTTEDFGQIVFNLVKTGKLGKTSDDKVEDFSNGYDFTEVFVKPFQPDKSLPMKTKPTKPSQRSGKKRK